MSLRYLLVPAAFGIGLVWAPAALAEVLDQAANGFTVEQVVSVDATVPEAFNAFTALPLWWDPAHTYSGDASYLSFTPEVGACWCERLPGGGGVEHLRIVYIAPDGGAIRMVGGLGPLQAMGASGAMTVSFSVAEAGAGTRVTLRYVVSGYEPGGMGAIAGPVDMVLGQAMARYAAFAGQGLEGPP
ncbi:MAG: ATPase [Caulobacterales bacterium]